MSDLMLFFDRMQMAPEERETMKRRISGQGATHKVSYTFTHDGAVSLEHYYFDEQEIRVRLHIGLLRALESVSQAEIAISEPLKL